MSSILRAGEHTLEHEDGGHVWGRPFPSNPIMGIAGMRGFVPGAT